MLKIVVLGSGSKGNSIFVDVDGWRFLVDCGFTKIATKKRLAAIGRTIEDIGGVLVTHEHKDHCAPWIIKENLIYDRPIDTPLISKFLLSHDSECYGYIIADNSGNKVAIIMDTGCIPEEAVPHLFDCSAILIETSYDVNMLIDGPYPSELQERIASTTGHLRLECAAEIVEAVAWPGLKYVCALHLSSKCINETLVRFELENAVKKEAPGCEIVVSRQDKPSKMMTLI